MTGPHINPAPRPQLSITLPARKVGAPSFHLKHYLNRLCEQTYNINDVEVLILIDSDDDLPWFYKIKKLYEGRIPHLRFIVKDPSLHRGYKGLANMFSILVDNISDSCQIWILQVTDTDIVYKHWDKSLVDIFRHQKRSFLAATDCDFHEATSLKGPNPTHPQPVYWRRGTLFPILSRSLLEVLKRTAASIDDPSWTFIGNSFNIPGFIGDLIHHTATVHNLSIHVETPLYFKEYKPDGWLGVPSREELRTKTLLSFFSKPVQDRHLYFASEVHTAYLHSLAAN